MRHNGALRKPLLILAAALALAGTAAAATPLAKQLGRALAGPGVDLQQTGALVVDLRTGEQVFARNPRLALVPASNEKLPVTFAALVALGPAFRFRTEVLGEGRLLAGGTWRGNLVLKGYGDPTLTKPDLAALARQLRALGVRRVTGAIVADESYFDARRIAPGWKASFYLYESPPLTALVVDRARFRGRTARDPATAAAVLFRQALVKARIAVPHRVKKARAGGKPLAAVLSAPLGGILRTMDAESDNFTAELVLKQLGAVVARKGTTLAGASVVRHVLADRGIPLAGVRIADGSGLSSLDRLTAQAIVAMLVQAWRDPDLRRPFVAALAVAGRTGTLEHRLGRPPALGNVRAKTGTTNLACALSGFVRDHYAFAVIENGRPVAFWAARDAQDRIVELLAAQ